MGALSALTSALGAFLLFWLQPLAGKMLLPLLGGAPSTWAATMLFFQLSLLLSYAAADAAVRRGPAAARRAFLSAAGLGALTLPVGLRGLELFPAFPALRSLAVLALSIGGPALVLGLTSPLVQAWFAAHPRLKGADPYPLYAAGNAGSLAALLLFPTLLERALSLPAMRGLWSAAWLLWAGLMLACGRGAGAAGAPLRAAPAPPPARRERLRWATWAFLPSSLSIAVTTHLSTDIAPAPFLWVAPLAVYLATYVAAFSRPVSAAWAAAVPPLSAAVLALGAAAGRVPAWVSVPAPLVLLAAVGMAFHGALAAARPAPARLTSFYLWLGLGGAAGGLFNALAAPLLFPGPWEYPLSILAACAGWAALGGRPARRWAAAGVLGAAALGAALMPSMRGRVLHRERSFYGVLAVSEDRAGRVRALDHGATPHGAQRLDPARGREPAAYYAPAGPAGDVFRFFAESGAQPRFVGVVGLGAGALASYGRPGQPWTFYELDPGVARLAADPRWFTYLSSSAAPHRVLIGDGRLRLAEAPDAHYDLLVIDAFGSDAVPVHLLTREALALYGRKLSPRGTLLVHVSNRFLRLDRALAATAAALGWRAMARKEGALSRARLLDGQLPSHWAAVTRDPALARTLLRERGWSILAPDPAVAPWTDDRADPFGVFDWRGA